MFLLRNKKKMSLNYPPYPLLSGALGSVLFPADDRKAILRSVKKVKDEY